MTAANEPTGRIFDIKRFAIHDGPGIRTTVFCKGCPLRCTWCHNPEAISPEFELIQLPDKCIGCGACVEVCPAGAHHVDDAGKRTFRRELCTACGRCVEACYAEAMVMYGRSVTVEDVMIEVRKDGPFYTNSGGGVTISGGEPLMQRDFTAAVLARCKSEGFDTALDTSGQAPWEAFEAVLPHTDLMLYDFKHADPGRHADQTGQSNKTILANLERLSTRGVPIEIRMPIIPTVNDSAEAVAGAARFLGSMANIAAVRLLRYHRMAGSKYERLGMPNTMPVAEPPTAEQLQRIAAQFDGTGLEVLIPPGP